VAPPPADADLRYLVAWDDQPFVAVTRVSGLRRTVDVLEHRDGAAPRLASKLPGNVVFHPATIERGLTDDGLFRRMADLAAESGPGTDVRRSIVVDVHQRDGTALLRCTLFRAWVSSYEPLAEVDQPGGPDVVERIVVEYDAWRIEPLGQT
jgi:phage tail-like protein